MSPHRRRIRLLEQVKMQIEILADLEPDEVFGIDPGRQRPLLEAEHTAVERPGAFGTVGGYPYRDMLKFHGNGLSLPAAVAPIPTIPNVSNTMPPLPDRGGPVAPHQPRTR